MAPLVEKTYELGIIEESEYIKCLKCGGISFHPKDIEWLYCAFCHYTHDTDHIQKHIQEQRRK